MRSEVIVSSPKRTSIEANCSSGARGGLPRPAFTWHAEQRSAMNVGPSPQSSFSETIDAHCR